MLYDKRWDKEIKADPFSLENLIAWLEKQPAAKEYDWSEAGSCLLAQWATANGESDPRAKSLELGEWSNHHDLAEVALGNLSECTFGAALARAREIVGK